MYIIFKQKKSALDLLTPEEYSFKELLRETSLQFGIINLEIKNNFVCLNLTLVLYKEKDACFAFVLFFYLF